MPPRLKKTRTSPRKSGPTSRHVIRLKIKALFDQGFGVLDTTRQLAGPTRKTVSNWFQKFEAQDKADEDIVLSQPRSGAPPKVTTPVKKQIIKFTKDKRKHSVRKNVKALKAKGIALSRPTVALVLKDAGLFPYNRRKIPRLNDKQKKKRVLFAKKYLEHDWESTLVTDEKPFLLFAATNAQNDRVWTDDPEKVPPVELVKHASSVNVWAGVSAKGKTELYFYEGTIGAKQHVAILEKAKHDFKKIFQDNSKWTYQQDGATAHSAKMTTEWLEDNVTDYISCGPKGDWPGNSPDLSFVENVWGWMDGELEENPPQTTATLKKRVKKIWKDMPQSMLVNMAKGMKQRLQSVIDKKGECIGK